MLFSGQDNTRTWVTFWRAWLPQGPGLGVVAGLSAAGQQGRGTMECQPEQFLLSLVQRAGIHVLALGAV